MTAADTMQGNEAVGEYVGRRRKGGAPASGTRNIYGLLAHPDPTWREAVVGSAYLLAAFGVGFGLAVGFVGAALRRRRRA